MKIGAILIEISGTCNARCPWCITGCQGHPHGGMMSFDDFCRCISRLEQLGVACPDKPIYLYNWGEPSLNRDLDEMLAHLGRRGLRGTISTNAIKSYLPSVAASRGLREVVFSISGMTERSEKLMHGAAAEQVLGNMAAMMRCLHGHGWQGQAVMSFHIYQHNISEVTAADDWCRRHGVWFGPRIAYFNDFNTARKYLAGRLESSILIKATKELMLFYVDELIAKMPAGWSCTLRNSRLVVDENCNVRTCCALPADHEECVLGSVFELGLNDIQALKDRRRVCAGCEHSGFAWWAMHSPQGLGFVAEFIADHRARMTLHALVPLRIRRLLGAVADRWARVRA